MKIRTKYDLGDTIIYKKSDGELKVAKIVSIEINHEICFKILTRIEYEIEVVENHKLVKYSLLENAILCKASKRLINKHLCKE